MQAVNRQFADGFFAFNAWGYAHKSKRPLDVHLNEGPFFGRDYLRSLIIPFMAEISG